LIRTAGIRNCLSGTLSCRFRLLLCYGSPPDTAKKGVLKRNERGNFTVEWGSLTKLTSTVANKVCKARGFFFNTSKKDLIMLTCTQNRSMELSELIKTRHSKRLLAMCDYTGIVLLIICTKLLNGNLFTYLSYRSMRSQVLVRSSRGTL
jgi:hypothetical protein